MANDRSVGHKAAKFIAGRVHARAQSLDSKVLDLYAGTGFVSDEMVTLGYRNITLLDISGNMIDSARQKKSLKDLKFVQADFSQWKSKERYNIVICSMGLHYNNANMNEFLASVERILEPNGLFACAQSINPWELWNHFRGIEYGLLPMRSGRGQTLVSYFVGKKRH